jgi:hypothetical protein
MQRFGHEDAEAFAGIVAEPTTFEAVFEAKVQTTLGAFGDYGDVGAEGVEVVALARQGHFAVPDYDAHGGSSYRVREKERKGFYTEVRREEGEKDEERFLSAQADTFAGANVKGKSVGLLRSK